MSTVRAAFNISATIVKSLVKVAGFGFVADAIEGGQEIYQLACSLKDETFGSAEAQMSGALRNSITDELASIEDQLGRLGHDEKSIDLFIGRLETSAKRTIARLLDDENALGKAITEPAKFQAYVLTQSAPERANYTPEEEHHLDSLIHCIADEYLTLAPKSPNYNETTLRVTVEQLIEIRTTLEEIKDGQQDLKDGQQDLKDGQQRIESRIDCLQTSIENGDPIRHKKQLKNAVWGSRPRPLKHWIERYPKIDNQTLQERVFNSNTIMFPSFNVLIGHAGSGKTRLAATIADTCIKRHWSLVAWIDASGRTKIENDLIAFGESLLNVNTDRKIDLPIRVKQVLATFRSTIKENCLFVFDNVETVDDLKDLLPDAPHTHVIITTRNSRGWDLHNDWNRFYLNDFTQKESCKYLAESTKDEDKTSANLIAEYLGNLPLAITQAADTASRYFNSSLSQYFMALTSCSDNDLEDLLEPIEGDSYTLGAILALHTAVQTTLDRIQTGKIREEAIRILDSLCYLDKSGVPSAWLKEHSNLNRTKAYRALLDASIIEESMDSRYTTFHRLFGHAIRKQSVKSAAVSNACNTLANASRIKTSVGNTLQYGQQLRELTTQVTAIAPHLSSVSSGDQITITTLIEEILWNCYDLSLYNYGAALYTSIEDLRPLQHNTETWIRILDYLGANLRALRKFADAHAVYDELFSLISTNHPKYYVYRSHLALLYYFEENDVTALTICKETLAQANPSDPYYGYYEYYFARITKDTINPFDMTKEEQCDQIKMTIGHLYHAIEHSNSNISSFEKQFEAHVFTALSQSYSLIGEHTEASEYSNKALKSARKALTPSHPELITYKHNLLLCKKLANGASPELITDLRSLIKEAVDRLSDSNPDVFTMRYNLARCFTDDRQFREAIGEYDSLIAISESSVESTYPETARLREERNHIAQLLWRDLVFRTDRFKRAVLSSPGRLRPGRMDDHEEVS